MTIADTLADAQAVENRINSIFQAASLQDRAQAVRRLFVEQLDLSPEWEKVSLAGVPGNVELPPDAYRIASLGGVEILYLDLSEARTSTDRVRKAEVDATVSRFEQDLGDDLLLVFANRSVNQLHFIRPKLDGARITLRRMVVERDLPRRTACEQIAKIYQEWQHRSNLSRALDAAFDVEPVTEAFFSKYKELFEASEKLIAGFGESEKELEEKRLFTQTLFNRLMFVYFLSRKGWLSFNDDSKDYLKDLWEDYPQEGETNFYRDRLSYLFFFGLNNPQSRDLNFKGRPMESIYGDVPFLNGGLFDKSNLDERESIHVPDKVISALLLDLFDRFNFTVMESTPFDIEVAVDPEMLGKVFENLVNGRHESGAYYTPRRVVSFMCSEALKRYLANECPTLTIDQLTAFVDDRDPAGIASQADQIRHSLRNVSVLDPACGSGAYLLGMMQELVELYTILDSDVLRSNPNYLHNLKLHIIERNLYGVDKDDFAVNIAMLRLWLSLSIEFDGKKPEALPNLDFKILCGDSLLGPVRTLRNNRDMFNRQAQDKYEHLTNLKKEYFRAVEENKLSLREQIRTTETDLKALFSSGVVSERHVDWRIAFGNILSQNNGFDIVLANPPYLFGESLPPHWPEFYSLTRGQFDAYWIFHERSLSSLCRPQGVHCFINSDAMLARDEHIFCANICCLT